MATEPDHKISNPNIDRTTPERPEIEQPMRRPDGEPKFEPELDPDRGTEHTPELEDDLGHDREPELIPPGTVVERNREVEHDEPDPKAIMADRANATASDRVDGRDGVDGSDAIGRDLV